MAPGVVAHPANRPLCAGTVSPVPLWVQEHPAWAHPRVLFTSGVLECPLELIAPRLLWRDLVPPRAAPFGLPEPCLTLQPPSTAVCLEAASPPFLHRAGEAAHNIHLTEGNAPGFPQQIPAGRHRLQFSLRLWPSSALPGRALSL
ncbi:hypothetical protein NDU88_009095 [Pleurodeles waltl]|uniref:Uncharacterized protein n=1 Tax=Pleurodeles waltl TaxID=8319 RepID=A0AAV7QQJ4_PLEWA|nr:hypothetical protein NDU88_009095 [Pleurodeles waltl]